MSGILPMPMTRLPLATTLSARVGSGGGTGNPAAVVLRGGGANAPAAVYAIRKWDEWLRQYAPPGAADYDFYQSLPALAQGNVAQQIFWYTAFTADMVAETAGAVLNDDGTPRWRMARRRAIRATNAWSTSSSSMRITKSAGWRPKAAAMKSSGSC